jgi:Anti-sigma-K factor rskA
VGPVVARSDPSTTLAPPGSRVITLVPVGAGTGARAQLYWEFGLGGRLVVSGLTQPPPGRTYQLWLGNVKLGNRASGGLLMVDSQGEGTLRFAPPRATWSPDIFGVTVERQGGALEPSDELVLVGELTRQTAATRDLGPAPASPSARPPSAAPGQTGSPTSPASSEPRAPSVSIRPAPDTDAQSATVTASLPPPGTGAEGPLVRIVPVPVERAWTVTQSVLRSLGWDIERTDPGDGLIRTEPRNVDFKNVGVYAAGTRHALDLEVRAVSETQTSISVKRELFEEQRIFWSRERTKLPARDTSVEKTVLDAIEHLL